MDALRVFGKDSQEQERFFQTVKKFNDDINMKLGLEKCATAKLIRCRLTTTSIRLREETTFE